MNQKKEIDIVYRCGTESRNQHETWRSNKPFVTIRADCQCSAKKKKKKKKGKKERKRDQTHKGLDDRLQTGHDK